MTRKNTEPYISTYLHQKGRDLGLPIAGNFELTARCNFNCPMCYVHMTQEQVASRVMKSRPAVANALRLLGLSREVLDMVSDGVLSAGHARTLLPLKDEKMQLSAAKKVCADGLSVRQTEALVKALMKKPVEKVEKAPAVDYVKEAEKQQ